MDFAHFTDAEVNVLLDALAYRMADRASGKDFDYTDAEHEALTSLAFRVAQEKTLR
jgi:hypothetical protein